MMRRREIALLSATLIVSLVAIGTSGLVDRTRGSESVGARNSHRGSERPPPARQSNQVAPPHREEGASSRHLVPPGPEDGVVTAAAVREDLPGRREGFRPAFQSADHYAEHEREEGHPLSDLETARLQEIIDELNEEWSALTRERMSIARDRAREGAAGPSSDKLDSAHAADQQILIPSEGGVAYIGVEMGRQVSASFGLGDDAELDSLYFAKQDHLRYGEERIRAFLDSLRRNR